MAHLKCVSASENCPRFNFNRPKAVLHLLSRGSRSRASFQYGAGYRVACLYCSKCRPVTNSSSLEGISSGGGRSDAGSGREVVGFCTFGADLWITSCPSQDNNCNSESLLPPTFRMQSSPSATSHT